MTQSPAEFSHASSTSKIFYISQTGWLDIITGAGEDIFWVKRPLGAAHIWVRPGRGGLCYRRIHV